VGRSTEKVMGLFCAIFAAPKNRLTLRTDINPKPILWLATFQNVLYHLVRNKKAIYAEPKKWFNYEATKCADEQGQVVREHAQGETELQEETTKATTQS